TRRAAPRRTIAAAVTPKVLRATARTARAARPAPAAAAPVNCDAQMAKFKSDPFATKSYDAWAACASRAGRHADVVRYMRIAIRDNPDFKRGWLHLGNAQKALGQTAQAKASWAKACAGSVAEACGR
ncbi:MAG: hypothetical protein KC503_41890, partial [Myxococcales bacterium]|nr:hypothetical protein [Myxococcales bacterium]